eukprot:2017726-Rhodomonas_salina.3
MPSMGVWITNLDQLYNQAAALDSILRRKVVRWARASGGMLAVRKEGAHVGTGSYKTVQQISDENAWHLVKWAGIKNPRRALEKLVRNYDYDASRSPDSLRALPLFRSFS